VFITHLPFLAGTNPSLYRFGFIMREIHANRAFNVLAIRQQMGSDYIRTRRKVSDS
jgi:hypothetical protein